MPRTLLVHNWHSPGLSQNGRRAPQPPHTIPTLPALSVACVKATRQMSGYFQPFFLKGNLACGNILFTEFIELDIAGYLEQIQTSRDHVKYSAHTTWVWCKHLPPPTPLTTRLVDAPGICTARPGKFNSSEVSRARPPASHAQFSADTGFQDSLTTCFLCFHLIWHFISSIDQLESELSLVVTNNKIIML